MAKYFLQSNLRTVLVALLVSAAATTAAHAAPALPQGQKTIALISAAGERQVIGHVNFVARADIATFELKLDAKEFQDEFLSMRPFSCLAGEKEMWCHLAYPYDLKKQISGGDLTNLEYALLFLHKPQTGYGIDPWNGLYFKMALGDDGAITGTLHDVNLDPLGVPPADKSARLIGPENLTVSDPATHRFAKIEIK